MKNPSIQLASSIGIVILAGWIQCVSAQKEQRTETENPESVINQLISTQAFGVIYVADGAGDGSVLNKNPVPAVKRIVALRAAAFPILIAHLDDTRLTSAKYKGGKYWDNPVAVPVGYVCLDILSQIVKDRRTLFVQGRRQCDFDGMGACIQANYYFNPDDYSTQGEHFTPKDRVFTAKRNWQKAYQSGILVFRFPSWLARFSGAYLVDQ